MTTTKVVPDTKAILNQWDKVLTDADLPAPALMNMLVEVYRLTPHEANVIVNVWLYADEG